MGTSCSNFDDELCSAQAAGVETGVFAMHLLSWHGLAKGWAGRINKRSTNMCDILKNMN